MLELTCSIPVNTVFVFLKYVSRKPLAGPSPTIASLKPGVRIKISYI